MTDAGGPTAPATPGRVRAFVALLTAVAAGLGIAVAGLPAPGEFSWLALPFLAVLLVAATWLVVPFRYGGSVDAVNLVEAALAPLIVVYPPLVVVVAAALAQVVEGMLRRLGLVKTLFNTASWAIAAGLGSLVMHQLGGGTVWPNQVLALLAALAVVGLVNNLAFAVVVTLAEPASLRLTVSRLLPVARLAWVGAWGVNAAMGVLFALAFLASPAAAAVFVVPLVVLHLAYRSYSAARADQARLIAAHGAAGHLAAWLYPLAAVPKFLREVAECFDAAAAELVVLGESGGRDVHRVDRATGTHTTRHEDEHAMSLEGVVSAAPGVIHLTAASGEAVARALAAAAASDCLAAPLLHADRLVGAILILDRGGFEGSREGEAAVLESLARETSGALSKGRLLADVLDERRKLAEIVESTSDGILTLGEDGLVLTWNQAMERITGHGADEVIGQGNLTSRLHLRTVQGETVHLCRGPVESLPQDLLITNADGTTRHLACSYSEAMGQVDGAALVVVARDVTPADEQEALREEVSRLVEAESARRVVVEQLQHAVVPAPLSIQRAHLAAAYEPSDPSAPTGGDLYDWQILPSGEVHIAVVDVLGHGVAATKDALAVVHTLRVVTASGVPLGDVVAKADELLQIQHPDLVATVIVARYNPDTGRLLVASGGHPPALIVTPRREVRQVAALGGVIGWPGAGSDGTAETQLEPGDTLILYTDGLVEARKNILDGMEDLERAAADVANLPADELAEELVARALAGAERRDDTLALVLRRDYVRAPDERCSWTISPDAAAASSLRHTLDEWLRAREVGSQDALVVAAELLANAVRAARTRVVLHIRVTGDTLVLDVTDDGIAPVDIAELGTTLPDPEAEQGRGLYIVRALSSHVDVLTMDEMTMIRAILPSPRQQRQAPRHVRTAGAGDADGVMVRTP